MNVVADNDFLAVESHLVERVKAAVAGMSPFVHVLTAAELASVAEANQPTPAVHIVYGNFRVIESRGDGHVTRLDHTWLAITATRNVSDQRTGEAARREASALMARAGAALAGFKPPGATRPLRMTPAPLPGFHAGYQYLPLAFLVETLFHATTP